VSCEGVMAFLDFKTVKVGSVWDRVMVCVIRSSKGRFFKLLLARGRWNVALQLPYGDHGPKVVFTCHLYGRLMLASFEQAN